MADYKKMYLKMFNAAEDMINTMEQSAADLTAASKILIAAQQACEEMYMADPEEEEPEQEEPIFQEAQTPEGE